MGKLWVVVLFFWSLFMRLLIIPAAVLAVVTLEPFTFLWWYIAYLDEQATKHWDGNY